MKLTNLISLLGLPATTDEAAVMAALTRKLDAADADKRQLVADLQAQIELVAALQAQIGALTAQVVERQVVEAVDAAVAAGKLMPAQRDWALGLGRKDRAQLNIFLACAMPMFEPLEALRRRA